MVTSAESWKEELKIGLYTYRVGGKPLLTIANSLRKVNGCCCTFTVCLFVCRPSSSCMFYYKNIHENYYNQFVFFPPPTLCVLPNTRKCSGLMGHFPAKIQQCGGIPRPAPLASVVKWVKALHARSLLASAHRWRRMWGSQAPVLPVSDHGHGCLSLHAPHSHAPIQVTSITPSLG